MVFYLVVRLRNVLMWPLEPTSVCGLNAALCRFLYGRKPETRDDGDVDAPSEIVDCLSEFNYPGHVTPNWVNDAEEEEEESFVVFWWNKRERVLRWINAPWWTKAPDIIVLLYATFRVILCYLYNTVGCWFYAFPSRGLKVYSLLVFDWNKRGKKTSETLKRPVPFASRVFASTSQSSQMGMGASLCGIRDQMDHILSLSLEERRSSSCQNPAGMSRYLTTTSRWSLASRSQRSTRLFLFLTFRRRLSASLSSWRIIHTVTIARRPACRYSFDCKTWLYIELVFLLFCFQV